MAFIWIAPLLARSAAGLVGVPIGLLATLALFAVALRRLHGKRGHIATALELSQA